MFYRHPMMSDGYLGKCKECTKVEVRSNRLQKRDYYNAYDRARSSDPKRVMARKARLQTPKGKQEQRRAQKEWCIRNAFKRVAHYIVSNAIRDKKLIPLPCEKCGNKGQAHHDDYSKPLQVRWLCSRHHADHHKKLRGH